MKEKWLENLEEFFKDKNILILGLGLEGKAALNFLGKNSKEIKYKKLYLLDKFKNTNDYMDVIKSEIGDKSLEDLNIILEKKEDNDKILKDFSKYDIILKSPGIKIEDDIAEKFKDKIYSQIEIFLKYYPGLTIGVTGTKGKSTTSALLDHVLNKCGYKSHLLGNIGNAVFYSLEDISEKDIAIIELSSFALEFIKSDTNIALITNVFIAHLDYHNVLDQYVDAKTKIFENIDEEIKQNNDEKNEKNEENANKEKELNKKYAYYKKYITESTENFKNSKYIKNNPKNLEDIICIKDLEIKIGKSNLIGKHNKLNAKAVKKVLLDLNTNLKFKNLTENNIDKAIESFNGLKHRLEIVYKDEDVRYINDSIATVPESTINAIASVKDLETLILGGDDNMLPTEKLIEYINNLNKDSSLKNIILLPDSGKRIKNEFNERFNIYLVNDVKEAAFKAYEIHKKGSVLLSPAARSYGYYKNFEDRGNQFKEEVAKIYKKQ